jgi:hypothetical protein
MYGFPKHRADLTEEQFHDHWRHPHATLVKRIPTIQAYAFDELLARPGKGFAVLATAETVF